MKDIINDIIFTFKDKFLRSKIFFIFAAFFIFRLFAAIPLPIVNAEKLKTFFEGSDFLGMVSLFSGGGLSKLSIVMLGVMPYITASIIMQLMTFAYPKMKKMQQEEGEAGAKKIANYSRLLSIPLAAIQAFGFMHLLNSYGVLENLETNTIMFAVLIATAGSVFIMWVGELISEFGIGNGLSLLIFAGIVASFPGQVQQLWSTFDITALPTYLGVSALFIIMIYFIIYVTEASRPVPVHHAKSARASGKAQNIVSSIPIKLNQAGVIPIIFAVSIISFPQMIFGFLQSLGKIESGSSVELFINSLQSPYIYATAYFVLVFFFTFFYTAVTFDPKKMSENLQKGGTFVPGVRPGEETEDFFAKVTTRVTFIGATFLGIVAVLPVLVGAITNNQSLAIGGTSILIVVSVGIDLIRKISAQVSVRKYLES